MVKYSGCTMSFTCQTHGMKLTIRSSDKKEWTGVSQRGQWPESCSGQILRGWHRLAMSLHGQFIFTLVTCQSIVDRPHTEEFANLLHSSRCRALLSSRLRSQLSEAFQLCFPCLTSQDRSILPVSVVLGTQFPQYTGWSNFILLLVISLSTVLCLLTFGYLLFSVPNLIQSNYTVLGNSRTIKTL